MDYANKAQRVSASEQIAVNLFYSDSHFIEQVHHVLLPMYMINMQSFYT